MTPTIPGLEVCEATHDDFVSSMAGLLDLQPLPKVLPVYPSKQLPCAAVNREEREYLRRVAVRDGLREGCVMSGMYCGGHGESLPCKTCAANLAKRIQRDAEAKEFGEPSAIPLVPERTTGDVWENAIRTIGVHAACEWFGYSADDEFTLETIRVLRDRSDEATGEPS